MDNGTGLKPNGLPRTGQDILAVHFGNGIDPSNGTAVFLLTCSLSTSPMLTHRLTFETQFNFNGNDIVLRTSTPLRVAHGPFASAEVAVEPVSMLLGHA